MCVCMCVCMSVHMCACVCVSVCTGWGAWKITATLFPYIFCGTSELLDTLLLVFFGQYIQNVLIKHVHSSKIFQFIYEKSTLNFLGKKNRNITVHH